MPRIIGIDPGISGGIAVLDGDNIVECRRLDGMLDDKYEGLERLLAYLYAIDRPGATYWCMEALPYGHPGQRGVNSAITMGVNWGKIMGMLVALGTRPSTPLPKEWQNYLFGKDRKKDTKETALDFVRQRYPSLNLYPGKTTKPHSGIVDAVCIATYAKAIGAF